MFRKDFTVFFTNCSTKRCSINFQEDAGLLEQSNDEEDTRIRKPTRLDEEEERTNINIAKIHRLRKLWKEEEIIFGSLYVSWLRAMHAKLNPGPKRTQIDSESGNYGLYDESSSNGGPGWQGCWSCWWRPYSLKQYKMLPGLLEHSTLTDANAEGSFQWSPLIQSLPLNVGLDRKSQASFKLTANGTPKTKHLPWWLPYLESIFLTWWVGRIMFFLQLWLSENKSR